MLTVKAAMMIAIYDVPSTMVTGLCGIWSVIALIFSSVNSKESKACSINDVTAALSGSQQSPQCSQYNYHTENDMPLTHGK
jgi:hypothetical protein